MPSYRLHVLVPVLLFGGCAFQTAQRVHDNDYRTQGVRYWLSAPYLLVTDRVKVAETQSLYVQEGSSFSLVAACKAGSNGKCVPPTSFNVQGESAPPPGGAPTPAKPAASASSALSIVWLPDYCEQYAYRSRTFLAKANVKVSLADGWRLESVSADHDSTAIVSKLIDLVGIDIQADAATRQAELSAAPGEELEALGTKAPKAPVYWIRNEVTLIPPGVYPLIARSQCQVRGEFNTKSIGREKSVTWSLVKS